jgi:hypothetical protein
MGHVGLLGSCPLLPPAAWYARHFAPSREIPQWDRSQVVVMIVTIGSLLANNWFALANNWFALANNRFAAKAAKAA